MALNQLGSEQSKHVSIEKYNALQREFAEFAYIVSHDLNAPMRHIGEFAQLLVKKTEQKVSDDEKLYVEIISSAIRNTEAMLEGMLQFSRLSTRSGEMEPVNCNEILERVRQVLATLYSADQTNYIVSELPAVYGDKGQLRQLLYHLLDNALKFRNVNVDPEIHINVESVEGMWRFRIEDNGIGVAQGMETQMFGLFKKLHPNSSYSGVGIGLTLCKKIVERHGGTIWYERKDGGSIFLFTLPQGSHS